MMFLIFEELIEAVDQSKPAGIVVHDTAQCVEEECALEVLVLRRLGVGAARRDDGTVVLHFFLKRVDVLHLVFVAVVVLDVEALEIGGPAFVDPHVRLIGGVMALPNHSWPLS